MSETEDEFYMPSGALMEKDGVSLIMYTIYLNISSPDKVREHIMTVLDGHAGNWPKTEFSGHLWLNCWNADASEEDVAVIEAALGAATLVAQNLTESHGMTSANGQALKFHHSFRINIGDDFDPYQHFGLGSA